MFCSGRGKERNETVLFKHKPQELHTPVPSFLPTPAVFTQRDETQQLPYVQAPARPPGSMPQRTLLDVDHAPSVDLSASETEIHKSETKSLINTTGLPKRVFEIGLKQNSNRIKMRPHGQKCPHRIQEAHQLCREHLLKGMLWQPTRPAVGCYY